MAVSNCRCSALSLLKFLAAVVILVSVFPARVVGSSAGAAARESGKALRSPTTTATKPLPFIVLHGKDFPSSPCRGFRLSVMQVFCSFWTILVNPYALKSSIFRLPPFWTFYIWQGLFLHVWSIAVGCILYNLCSKWCILGCSRSFSKLVLGSGSLEYESVDN